MIEVEAHLITFWRKGESGSRFNGNLRRIVPCEAKTGVPKPLMCGRLTQR
jgi:hypothetical protein